MLWDRLPREPVGSPPLEIPKPYMDTTLCDVLWAIHPSNKPTLFPHIHLSPHSPTSPTPERRGAASNPAPQNRHNHRGLLPGSPAGPAPEAGAQGRAAGGGRCVRRGRSEPGGGGGGGGGAGAARGHRAA